MKCKRLQNAFHTPLFAFLRESARAQMRECASFQTRESMHERERESEGEGGAGGERETSTHLGAGPKKALASHFT